MPDQEIVSVRYLVDDVAAFVDFYTTHFGFSVLTSRLPAFADVAAETSGSFFPVHKAPPGEP